MGTKKTPTKRKTTNKKPNLKALKDSIFFEYAAIIITVIAFILLMPMLFDYMVGDNTGIDGIGNAVAVGFLIKIIRFILVLIFFVINPIRILIKYKAEISKISQKAKRIATKVFIALPLVVGACALFMMTPIYSNIESRISDFANGAYTVEKGSYKTPKEFKKQLIARGLYFDDDAARLQSRLAENYLSKNPVGNMTAASYYPASNITTMEYDTYYGDYQHAIIPEDADTIRYPVYVYNASLIKPSKTEDLQYAPFAMNSKENYSKNPMPVDKDYYIVTKILYVNDDIYAIIGVGESYPLGRYFFNQNEKYGSSPYYVILSEKDTITTYYNGKYYPKGSIEMSGNNFNMRKSDEVSAFEHYPIHKVAHLDAETINHYALEMQKGVLKESIENLY